MRDPKEWSDEEVVRSLTSKAPEGLALNEARRLIANHAAWQEQDERAGPIEWRRREYQCAVEVWRVLNKFHTGGGF